MYVLTFFQGYLIFQMNIRSENWAEQNASSKKVVEGHIGIQLQIVLCWQA